jgi:hypothetical protein
VTHPSILRAAHGAAADGGAVLVAETPVLDELGPPDAARTAVGLALRSARGRPFQPGNTAASGRGPSLTRITCDPSAPEEQQRVHRKAASLKGTRQRELEVQMAGPISSGVKVELVAWARATAWAELYDRAGDATKAAALSEKASGHQLKAIGIAEREALSRQASPGESFAALVAKAIAADPGVAR